MMLYLSGATLTFSVLLNAFIKDQATSKTDVTSWIVLSIATLIWPVVLPRVLWKKLQKFPKSAVPHEITVPVSDN